MAVRCSGVFTPGSPENKLLVRTAPESFNVLIESKGENVHSKARVFSNGNIAFMQRVSSGAFGIVFPHRACRIFNDSEAQVSFLKIPPGSFLFAANFIPEISPYSLKVLFPEWRKKILKFSDMNTFMLDENLHMFLRGVLPGLDYVSSVISIDSRMSDKRRLDPRLEYNAWEVSYRF